MRSWHVIDGWIAAYDEVVDARRAEVEELLTCWDERLADLGGDPTRHDWRQFRPLRLSREEDWSDWLAHLMQTSTTGTMVHALFATPRAQPLRFANPRWVRREVVHGGHRADIVALWRDGRAMHIEVKVGDENLEKTTRTSENVMDRYDAASSSWAHFILLLDRQLPSWGALKSGNIQARTWDDAAVAIRRALLTAEHVTWKAWAWAFLGAVEQRLVGYAHPSGRHSSALVGRKIDILNQGLAGGVDRRG